MNVRRVPTQKLTPPPAWPGALARPHLEAALDEAIAANQHVGLVAGMGYGKTTLAAAWAARRAAVWVSLDADDAELDAFLAALVTAFERALPGFRTEARELLGRARERDGAQAALAALIADLDEQATTPLALVIDDYQAAASASLDALLVRLLKYLPTAIRLVLLTRKAPEIPAAALQASHRLRVIGEADLAFTPDELAALRPGGQPQELIASTGGWPAAMGMPPELLDAYVDEQLLAGTPKALRELLARLALVESFDAALCEEALGVPLPPDALATLLAERLVLRRGVDRYGVQPALGAVLVRRYLASTPRQERQALFVRVGTYYWDRGQPLLGLRLWIDHVDASMAAARLCEVADAWLSEGRLEALASGIEALGAAAREPALLAIQGDLHRRWGEFGRAEEAYGRALEAAPGPWQARARLGLAQAASARGNVALARQLREEAGEGLDGRQALDALNLDGALALLSGATGEAIGCFQAAAAQAERLGDRYARARATHNLGICQIRQGQFDQALASYDEAIACASADGTPVIWMSPINRALVLVHLGRPAEGEEAADAALALVRRFRLAREEAYALRVLGFARIRRGAFEAAEGCFAAAERMARDAGDGLGLAYTLNFRAELAHAMGDLRSALVHVAAAEAALGERAAGVLELAQVKVKVLLAMVHPDAHALAAGLITRARAGGYQHIADVTAQLVAAPASGTKAVRDDEPQLRIRCFGEFRGWRADGAISPREWQTQRAKLLLAYLVHFPEGATKTQLLGEVFFGEEVSNDLMNVTILRLRKALEPALGKGQPSRYIQRIDGRYVFNPQARLGLDTRDFMAALQGARHATGDDRRRLLEQALDAYRGDFLPEHQVPWVITLRQRFQDLALDACRELAVLQDEQGPRAALAVVQRAVEIDPLSEEFNRALIVRYQEAGEAQRAVQHFRLCEQRYKELLDTAPPEALARLVARP